MQTKKLRECSCKIDYRNLLYFSTQPNIQSQYFTKLIIHNFTNLIMHNFTNLIMYMFTNLIMYMFTNLIMYNLTRQPWQTLCSNTLVQLLYVDTQEQYICE